MTDESKIVEAFESQFHEKPTRRKDGQYLRDYWRALFNQFRSGYVAGVGARPESEAERTLNDLAFQLSRSGAGTIEHLLACGAIGNHTTVIGKSRYEELKEAERVLREYGISREESLNTYSLEATVRFRKAVEELDDLARKLAGGGE